MGDRRDLAGSSPRSSVDPVPSPAGRQTSTATLVQTSPARTGSALLTATPGKRAARGPALSAGAQADASTYVGRRVASRPVDAPSSTLARDVLDTGTINAVLAGLEPTDHTTSFVDEVTESMPVLTAADIAAAAPQPGPAPSRAGKRRATKHSGRRGPLFRGLPSAPLLLGVAALVASAGGAVTLGGGAQLVDSAPDTYSRAANALTGTSGTGSVSAARGDATVSRDAVRAPVAASDPAVEQAAAARSQSIAQDEQAAEKRDAFIAKNQWQVPLESYRLTARYGQYGLWSSYHTGLDFAAPSGTPIYAIANGVVTSTGYDGAYGNKTVITLDDGTELWFCHQSAYATNTGDTVRGGDLIGYVGSTGNVTGPHVHIEVRPGGGDPIDPYAAFVEHGVTP